MVTREMPDAVVLACGRSSIWGDGDRLPNAMLPACGKPLIGHRLDELRDLGVSRVAIVSDCRDEIAEELPFLALYQMDVRLYAPEETPDLRSERILVTTADTFAEPALLHLVEASENAAIYSRDGNVIGANVLAEQLSLGLTVVRGHAFWEGTRFLSMARRIEIATAAELIDLNIAILTGQFAVSRISGLEVAPHVHLEWYPSVRPASIAGPAHIGDGSIVHRSATVRDSIVGRGAVILPHADISRTIVLPGATVPRNATISDAIVTKSLVLFADGDADNAVAIRADPESRLGWINP